MGDSINIIENATIKYDGPVREAGPNGEPIDLFIIETVECSYWFEFYYEFAKVGDDFWITVGNFGLLDKGWAGNVAPAGMRSFSLEEMQTAKSRLERLFMGPKENPSLPYLPFRSQGDGKCLGVRFRDNWILVK